LSWVSGCRPRNGSSATVTTVTGLGRAERVCEEILGAAEEKVATEVKVRSCVLSRTLPL
jgi:hypothetical protein